MPPSFVAIRPRVPGSESDTFHKARPVPISATAVAMFFRRSETPSRKSKLGAMLSESAPLPELSLVPDSLLISSNDARDLLASFAAFPVPLSALVWLFKAFADSVDAARLLPEMEATNCAIFATTAVSTCTSAVNAGIITSTNGCTIVNSAPLSCAIAAAASGLVLITSPAQLRSLESACVMTVNTSAERTTDLMRLLNASALLAAFFVPSFIFPAF